MVDWNSIIWFVIWAVAFLVALALIVYAVAAVLAFREFKSAKAEFDKGFESDFFKRNR